MTKRLIKSHKGGRTAQLHVLVEPWVKEWLQAQGMSIGDWITEKAIQGFFLFEGYEYYPGGGLRDYSGAYLNVKEAQLAFESKGTDDRWAHVVTFENNGPRIVSEWIPREWNEIDGGWISGYWKEMLS